MQRVVVWAPAKINLTLDVGARRADGYHEIDTIMQTVDIYDCITANRVDAKGMALHIPDSDLPCDERNTAYRAARYFYEYTGIIPSVQLTVKKVIPMQAGMAGGSADAAGTLLALNMLYGQPLTAEQCRCIGERVGADVPFCQLGGTARATGIGTDLQKISPLPSCAILVIKPMCGVSTAQAYQAVDSAVITRRPDTRAMCDALAAQDISRVGVLLCNVFEEAIALPEVARIRNIAIRNGAIGCRMTGSGSAVYAVFHDAATAYACGDALRAEFPQQWVCCPCEGPIVIEMV